MSWQRQFSATVLSLMCLTAFRVQARLCDPVLLQGEHARTEAYLRQQLRHQTDQLVAYVPHLAKLDVRVNFDWTTHDDFVTDLQGGEILVLVPRTLGSVAALSAAGDAMARLRAAFTHQVGHLIYTASGGGGDPALAELFGDVLTALDLNDPGAVTRAFAVDGRPATVESARLRAFDPRPHELTAREWSAPAYRLNLVKAELARRAEWAKLTGRPRERGQYVRHVLECLVRTSRTDYGPATAASAGRMNLDVIRALGYH